MNAPDLNSENLSWRQLLAAYVDNELDDAARGTLEQRLRSDPTLANELDGQRRFSPENVSLWNTVGPPPPSERDWNDVRARIEHALLPTGGAARRRWQPWQNRWFRRGILAAAAAVVPSAAAAAVVLISLLAQRPTNPLEIVTPLPDVESNTGVFSIVQPNDVEIVSVRPADSKHLVVGQSPLNEDVALAAATEIQLESVQPARDGPIPEVSMGGGGPPMIYVPVTKSK